jgi:hypothetical protein
MVEVMRTRQDVQTAWMYVLPHKHKDPTRTYMPIGSSWRTWKISHPELTRPDLTKVD